MAMADQFLDLRDLASTLSDLTDKEADGTLDDDETEELTELRALEAQLFTSLEAYADNEPTMIADWYFKDYCQELAEDVGYVSGSNTNPLMNYIDWEAWADACKQDYSELTYDGRTYLIRDY